MAAASGTKWAPPFYIGLHDGDDDHFVSPELSDRVSEQGFDMLTSQITNSRFRDSVFDLLKLEFSKQSLSNLSNIERQDVPVTTVPLLDHLDTSLVPGMVTTQLLGHTSNWIDICSPDPLVSGVSKQVLLLEVQYAAFCGIDHIIIEGPKLFYGDAQAGNVAKFARAIQECMEVAMHTCFYIKMPMFDHPDLVEPGSEAVLPTREEYLDTVEQLRPQEPEFFQRWDQWHLIRTACKYSSRVFLGKNERRSLLTQKLAFTVQNFDEARVLKSFVWQTCHATLTIPKHIPDAALQSRWFSEPVRLALFEDSAFLRDGRGNLGLSKPSRDFLSRILHLKVTPWMLIWGVGPISDIIAAPTLNDASMMLDEPIPAEAGNASKKQTNPPKPLALQCLHYLRNLQQNQPSASEVERYGSGYQDYLQVPLQPLTDNLESMTYEVFEKDPVKYDLYEEAIGRALRDWKEQKRPTSGPEGRVLITVAGAGRGPLVTRAIVASQAEGVPIELWAVEKNPNAFVLLQKHNQDPAKWNNAVHLVQSDMRSWPGPLTHDLQPLKIDILVTELLGSFGDNELSPECLDGILHHLSPQGISIPQNYTPFLTPVSAPKIHADITQRASWEPAAPETPSVVWLHSIDYLSIGEKLPIGTELRSPSGSVSLPPIAGIPNILPVWRFDHGPQAEVPIKTINKHNERFARLSFRCKNRGVCHGLGGYFESVLYPGVELSTNPNTIDDKSRDMISWFPIFFPLKTPMYLPDNGSVTCSIWRYTDGRKVWYEYMLETWLLGPNHQRIKLGQSELHSSIKNGCMM